MENKVNNIIKSKISIIKGSMSKIKIITSLIKKKTIENALIQLEFCKKKISKNILKILKSAISNAQNNYKINIDELYIKKIIIEKSRIIKRSKIRARGKIDKIKKKFHKITIIIIKNNGTKS